MYKEALFLSKDEPNLYFCVQTNDFPDQCYQIFSIVCLSSSNDEFNRGKVVFKVVKTVLNKNSVKQTTIDDGQYKNGKYCQLVFRISRTFHLPIEGTS